MFFSFVFSCFFYFIELYLFDSTVSVSAIRQSESAICIHTCPLFWIYLVFRSPQRIEERSLCSTACSY